MGNSWRAAVLWVAAPCLAACQTAILQLRITEGDGGVHLAGSRNTRPISVEVTDETGRPVERAAVSFHLPEEGPGGAFLNGLRTDVALTDASGRASIRGIQWNRIPGRFQIRIVASYEQARAGITSSQYIDGPAGAASSSTPAQPKAMHSRWLWIGALAAGGLAGGMVALHPWGNAAQPGAAANATVTVGPPVITVGKP